MKKIKYIILIIFIISVCSISYILLNKPKNVEKRKGTIEKLVIFLMASEINFFRLFQLLEKNANTG